MSLQAWPFLVSRNALLGYRTIVAPDFLVQSRQAGLLAEHTPGERTDVPRHLSLSVPGRKPLTLIYHIVPAQLNGTAALDGHGRPIDWVVGFVFPEQPPFAIDAGWLYQAHELVQEDYAAFWPQRTAPPVRGSRPVRFTSHGQPWQEEEPLRVVIRPEVEKPQAAPRPAPSPPRKNRNRPLLLLLALETAVLLGLVVMVVVLLRRLEPLEYLDEYTRICQQLAGRPEVQPTLEECRRIYQQLLTTTPAPLVLP